MNINQLFESILNEDLGNLAQLQAGPLINVLKQKMWGGTKSSGETEPIKNKFQMSWNDRVGAQSEIIDGGVVKNGLSTLRKAMRENNEIVGFALYIGGKAICLAISDEETLRGKTRYSKMAYDLTPFQDAIQIAAEKAREEYNAQNPAWRQKDKTPDVRLPTSANPISSARVQKNKKYDYSARAEVELPDTRFQGRGVSTGEFDSLFADFDLVSKAVGQPITVKYILKDTKGYNLSMERRNNPPLSRTDINQGRADIAKRLKMYKLSKKPTADSIEKFVEMAISKAAGIVQFAGRSYKLVAQTYDKIDPLMLLNGGGFTIRYRAEDPGAYETVDLKYRFDPTTGTLAPYYATWSDPRIADYGARKQEAVLDTNQYLQSVFGQKLNDKPTVVKTLLEKFKANQYNEVVMLIGALEKTGYNWPEFAAIKKSIAIELNKPKE